VLRSISMNPHIQPNPGFKRQVVFRIGTEDWPLLESAAREHGSIQAAVLAGIRALASPVPVGEAGKAKVKELHNEALEASAEAASVEVALDPYEEITAREAAALLGLQTSTVSGYIRSERLPGHYDGDPTWRGWLTTRGAVDAYKTRH
jgi:hypothetical protein